MVSLWLMNALRARFAAWAREGCERPQSAADLPRAPEFSRGEISALVCIAMLRDEFGYGLLFIWTTSVLFAAREIKVLGSRR